MSSYYSRRDDRRSTSSRVGAGDERRRLGRDEGRADAIKQEKTARGLKNHKFGSAFIGTEQEAYLQENMPSQLVASKGDSPTHVRNAAGVTPRTVVDELVRSGHFDQARKQLLASFQSSPHKADLLASLQAFLLAHIDKLAPEKRSRLAAQGPILQQSELGRELEESDEVVKIFEAMLSGLRQGQGGTKNDETQDDAEAGEGDEKPKIHHQEPTTPSTNSLFGGEDGTLYLGLQERIKDTIEHEKRRAREAATSATPAPPSGSQSAQPVSTATGSAESDADSSTPRIKSTAATPLRREAFRES